MPSKQWDEEESDSSTPPSSPPVAATTRRRQFDDEEDDSDVLDSWDAAEDSEVEREKERKATAAKAKAAEEAAAQKKSKAERIALHQAQRAAERLDGDESSGEEETEGERRERLRRTEQEADLKHAEDLFGDAGSVPSGRKAQLPGATVAVDPKDPTNTVNLGDLALFKPQTKLQFENLRNTLVPILTASSKKAHYTLFLQEFAKQLAKELPSDQIKKISSSLTALSNEKMKEEKAAEKGGKKSKAAKTKTTLNASRASTADVSTYDEDAFGDDDFM